MRSSASSIGPGIGAIPIAARYRSGLGMRLSVAAILTARMTRPKKPRTFLTRRVRQLNGAPDQNPAGASARRQLPRRPPRRPSPRPARRRSDLAGLQATYRTAASTDEQRLVAIAFAQEAKLHEGRKPRPILNGRDGAAVADFFAANFVHTKGPAAGRAFELEDWQRAFVDEFYKRDEEGRRIYRLGVLGVPRGNGKSPLAAGLGLYELLTRRDSPDVFCAAGSREQARIVFNFASSFVETGPLLDVVRVGRNELIYPDGTGSMRVVSADGSLQFGHSVSCAIVDEAHVFATQKHQDLWEAFETALHKRLDSFLLAITTAGSDRTSLLGRLVESSLAQLSLERPDSGLTVGRDEENGVLLWWYAAPDTAELDDEATWRAANPASWVDLRDLRRQRNSPGTSESAFRRLHLNQWTHAEDVWITPARWAACRSEEEIPERRRGLRRRRCLLLGRCDGRRLGVEERRGHDPRPRAHLVARSRRRRRTSTSRAGTSTSRRSRTSSPRSGSATGCARWSMTRPSSPARPSSCRRAGSPSLRSTSARRRCARRGRSSTRP